MKTQEQFFWDAHKKMAGENAAFMDAVHDGLTSVELAALIARRPDTWEKFSHWIPKLP